MHHTDYNSQCRQWSGPNLIGIFNPNISIGGAVLDALDRQPNKIGQISDNNGVQITNAEIRLKSIRCAQNLIAMGYTKDDVFSFYVNNNHRLAPIVFGSLIVGAAVNPLDPNFKKHEICHMIRLTKPSIVFCESENLQTLQDALDEAEMSPEIFVFGNVNGYRSIDELLIATGHEKFFVAPDIGDGTKEIAAILCSSGTTGLSKGVCLSHAALLYQLYLLNVNAHDTIFTFSSIYWISGFGLLLTGTLHESVRIITTEPFTPERFLNIVEKYKVTYVITSPAQMASILKEPTIQSRDLSSLKQYTCGGATVHNHLSIQMNRLLENGGVYTVYGMSEAAGLITNTYPNRCREGSAGQLACGVCIKVLDAEGNQCGPNEVGEICLRLKYNFIGYYGNEEETLKTLDENGFIHSGDIGYFDVDGYLYLIDRKKDMLKYKNYQISPSELENIVLGLDGIKNVCVVGIPDDECTDLPAAVVIKANGSTVTAQQVRDIVADKLSDAKQLRGGVYFVDSFPFTPSGKVIRRDVQTIAIKLFNECNDNTQL